MVFTVSDGTTAAVAGGGRVEVLVAVPASGAYDVTVTADAGDGFERRFAGRVFG
ncbi:DUF756 domain-containing protein [Streptomyces olivoreticuli]|uniref:phospholipase domain-containing protein n=1 Tax=Streptomyces olivoreticuli TaxID=68246 RepID=UPI0026597809|nr:phospholipase domain-containing protein [Streptomyces olivoreticuli]WKK27751.1 DUF756 domain-containing protein [Streptomyces olivoreticuli]